MSMECPKCKYANGPGALYCQLCYEVLLKSAAKSYLHSAHQERKRTNALENNEEPSEPLMDLATAKQYIQWDVVFEKLWELLSKNRKGLLLGSAACLSLMTITFLSLKTTRLHLFGIAFDYRLPKTEKMPYLIGFRYDIAMWSQSEGRMDTPFPKIDTEETGTIQLKPQSTQKMFRPYKVEASQWIKTTTLPTGPQTEQIDGRHASLAPAILIIDKNGTLLDRRQNLSSRLGRSVPFLIPRFPQGTFKPGKQWHEKVEWIDTVGEWKIYWHGILTWTFVDYVEENTNHMAKLIYTASLVPNLWEAPAWAGKMHIPLSFSGNAGGEAIWNIQEHVLTRNNFTYNGQLHIPIPELKKIPWVHRVGRLLATGPGEVVMEFNDRIDARKL